MTGFVLIPKDVATDIRVMLASIGQPDYLPVKDTPERRANAERLYRELLTAQSEAKPQETERNDYVSDAQARDLFGTEDDEELPEGRVRVCDGEWVRIPGGYYFDKSAGPLHTEAASEACDHCAVTIVTPSANPDTDIQRLMTAVSNMLFGDMEREFRELEEAAAPFIDMHTGEPFVGWWAPNAEGVA